MRRAALAVALVLAGALATTACGAQACPAALLSGVLQEQAGELVVVGDGGAPPTRVKWPAGDGVRRVDGVLVVTDIFGNVKARDGDIVRLGGGEDQNHVWVVCGMFEVGPAPAA